jgi:ATP-dependent DNA helicase RecG
MVTLEDLEQWLLSSAETEQLEFKEAKQQYDSTKLLEYCVALANERGGYLVLGVTDHLPRKVVGTQAFSSIADLNKIKAWVFEKLKIRIETTELIHSDGRVLVFEIPFRPFGQALNLDGKYLMRVGEALMPMQADQLKRIFAEDQQDWFSQAARMEVSPEDVIALLDTQTYFELLNNPYPTNRDAVLEKLQTQGLIKATAKGWLITNLAAILLAKKLDAFSSTLARKATRVVVYEGTNKLRTRNDWTGNRGYAVGFEALVDFVHLLAPQNHFIEEVIREEIKMFPRQALRELIANALVHQDFLATGTSVMVEMYSDRVEISNPGIPPIAVDRFIDEYRSRNERLADLMRRFGICEEKGSGIDKVISAVEDRCLPAPDFRVGATRTTSVLFAYKDFAELRQADRVRACYQHCVLRYLNNQVMSDQTLGERFRLDASQKNIIDEVIRATLDAGLIKPDGFSLEGSGYLPHWA